MNKSEKKNKNITFMLFIFDFYHFKYSDYCLHLYCLFTMFGLMCSLAFFGCFLSTSGAYTELLSTRINCSNSINHNWVQVLSYSKYSLLFLPVVRIEPANSR